MICVNEERHEPFNGFKHCLTAVAIRFELVRKGYVLDGTCQTKRKKNRQKEHYCSVTWLHIHFMYT